MPRTSRAVAQRLASQAKSRKRRPRGPGGVSGAATPDATAARSPSVDEILDEVVPSAAGSRAASTPTLNPIGPASPAVPAEDVPKAPAAARRRAGGSTGRSSARPVVVRRRYSEYAEEYHYIWSDLRRIAVVAGVMVALLVALTFFIQ